MADNPHGYGQYTGHYPPPSSYPSMLGSPSAHPPYSYPTPGNGVIPPANYVATHNAYDHNLNRIPGLGLGGAQMLPATTFSASTSQPWPTQGHNAHANNFFQSQQPPPASLIQKPPASYPQPVVPLEDGELGEFEDLYDPKDSINTPKDVSQVERQSKSNRSLNNLDSGNGSVGDAEGSSIYDPHDPHVIQDNAVAQAVENPPADSEQDYPMDDDWEPSYPDRERSGSYSPYLSPREVHRKISMAKATTRDTQATDHVPATKTSDTLLKSKDITPASSGLPSKPPTASSATKHEGFINGSSLPRSPLEAKKKAQEAILGLWSLKVRYQDYIEEGIDANVVKALFKDIGLDVPVSKSNSVVSQTTSDAPPVPVAATAPTKNASHKPQTSLMSATQAPPEVAKQPDNKDNKDKGSETKVTQKSAAEERKDKIARKLAAMAQKTTTTQSPGQGASVSTPIPVPAPAPAPVSAPAPAPVPATIAPPAPAAVVASVGTKSDATNTPLNVPKTRAENTAILQQKLAALRRQQAQSAADKAQAASNESTAVSSPARTGPSPPNTNHNGDSTPKSRSTIPIQQSETQQISSTTPQVNQNDEGIPGLSFQSLALPQPPQGSNRSLKRPVASDFDNYTPRSETLKRTRTDERLVIDVSDDEDVEMEIGSPTDDLPPVDSSSATTRQALNSFLPLSDGPSRRQQDSPVSSSAPTPPIHGARVDVLNKRIEDLKRQIAEAEAKTAAKKATTQLSPRPLSPAVEQTISVPKLTDRNTTEIKATHNRRDRIVSYELPRVSAALKEKQDKLRQIVAEAARLELEVQASLAEEQELKAEMEELVSPSATDSPEPDEQQPVPRDVSPPPEPTLVSNSQHNAEDECLVKPQSSHDEHSPVLEARADVDTELTHDESLQVADTTQKTNTIDLEMTDADLPASSTANTTPIVDETPKEDTSPSSLDADGLVQPHMIETMDGTKQKVEEPSTSTDPEAKSVVESAAPAVSSSSSEPHDESSESDVSMQQSVPDLSQSDDDTYEPMPVEISDSQATRENVEQRATEEFDDIPEEPSPIHTSIDQEHQESEQTSNEVKSRSSEEPLLLTTSQDSQNKSPLEDLLTYKSPLSYFRAYRFHPKYFEEVSGGLKSMTFNARIDPMRELCPQVLAGEPCPKGSSCEYQHFDSMILQDAEIITQLGSADMFVGETRTKFIEGLKRVLNDLKANRVKDFDRITKAIVKHRQEFLGDKTKVLALDSSAS
ncbi:hypothetical protein F5B22DRAFT_616128 [Xylaria bambusicola]|uniref:uncharacterized protein n=1 Tax=Xylaria bambusicola TaxID=326684 RepID=UPI0020088A81|nr:uncharacterized protein F5B22DRAFT_616128 [Xylaria bambusicola]KAI0509589.1 hypothetical protein F5B22DRAFT_616128 [Xylaria bambusicola]